MKGVGIARMRKAMLFLLRVGIILDAVLVELLITISLVLLLLMKRTADRLNY